MHSIHSILYTSIIFFISFASAAYIPNLNVRSHEADGEGTGRFRVDTTLIPGYQEAWNDNLSMNAGHVSITEHNSTIYFWSFQSKNNTLGTDIYEPETNNGKRPLIVWLNGGPGCSSMDGALLEVGPLRIKDKTSIVWNDGWFNVADLIFVDQPIGTGFSYRMAEDDFDTDLAGSSQRLLHFLNNYFDLFPENYEMYDSIIVAGESYAGQYIPHLARLMMDSDRFSHKLSALMLGNAWLDPNLQSLSYIPFAIDSGMINPKDTTKERQLTSLLESEEKCQNYRSSDSGKESFEGEDCSSILYRFLRSFRLEEKRCYNVYDITKSDTYPACGNNWPELLPQETEFLNNNHIQDALNVLKPGHISHTWGECSGDVNRHYSPSKDPTGATLLKGLLDEGLKINLFSGTNDLICNYLSTEMVIKSHLDKYLSEHNYQILLSSLENSEQNHKLFKRGIDKFEMDSIWFHDDSKVGSFWQRGNLTYTKIDNSSHMVAYDVSKTSIGLINLTLRNYIDGTKNNQVKTFSDSEVKHEIEEKERLKKEAEAKAKQEEEEKKQKQKEAEEKGKEEQEKEKEHEIEKKKAPKKYLALFLLIVVLAILAIYFFKVSTRKPSRYSALAGAPKPQTYSRYAYDWVSGSGNGSSKNGGKKKRVHWMDLEELDEDGSLSPSNINDNDNDHDNNNVHFKSYEMEDLQLDSSSNASSGKPREGSFESEELELQLKGLKQPHVGESL